MPDKEVKTVQDQIFYQYAKIVACSAFGLSDGREAKRKHYGFIKKTFRELRDGVMSWSDIMREDWQLVDSDKQCSYCGSTEELQREHIVPRSLDIKPECGTCETIQGIHNQVWACRDCNLCKKDGGLYGFYRRRFPEERKYFDIIPPLVEKKYLKTIYRCHECAGTLDSVDADGEMSVLDVDGVVGLW